MELFTTVHGKLFCIRRKNGSFVVARLKIINLHKYVETCGMYACAALVRGEKKTTKKHKTSSSSVMDH